MSRHCIADQLLMGERTMSFHSWLQDLRSALAQRQGQRHRGRQGSHRAATHRPSLEVLEDRCVPAFLAPVDYAVGPYPYAVVTADFNGDGRLDLATANWDRNYVSVLLGNGDGAFQDARNYATGQFATTIAAGDFNGDGKLDLVTGHAPNWPSSEYAEINLLLGNGDGSFQWTGTWGFDSIDPPSDMAVGDFDADGSLDLAVSGCRIVSVYLGSGQGGFKYKSTFGAPRAPDGPAIVAADFNHDGKVDLAWGNSGAVVDVVLS